MKIGVAIIALTALRSSLMFAQTAAEHIALGDRARGAMSAVDALRHYEAAVAADSNNVEALWRASSEAIDLGEFNDVARDSLYRVGERYARRAIRADAASAMAHFALAKALGRRALSVGVRERVKFATAVHDEALESLKLDSLNAGSWHVIGLWHAHVMSLSGFSRFIAQHLLGGKAIAEANWNDAERFLLKATALEPEHIVHRIGLAWVYQERGDKPKAREQYQLILRLPAREYNDSFYQRQAEAELRALR